MAKTPFPINSSGSPLPNSQPASIKSYNVMGDRKTRKGSGETSQSMPKEGMVKGKS
jgi:hypothetical protein